MISRDRIIKNAEELLREAPSPYARCYEMCEELEKRLSVPGTILKKSFGEERITHYVLAVDNKHIQEVEEEGVTYIDPTITQFNETNYNSGDVKVNLGTERFIEKSIGGKVGFFPPSSEERKVWYHTK